ncbi:hypothetical protein, partial [Sinomicrobium pectinilyticum]|uniref:hypothetical protein n=1 Tax=Sinomicrobium pectinilyticum TaxID=1084421 RepID=UPI0019CF81DD
PCGGYPPQGRTTRQSLIYRPAPFSTGLLILKPLTIILLIPFEATCPAAPPTKPDTAPRAFFLYSFAIKQWIRLKVFDIYIRS